jgi:hypothetical protein
METAVAHAASRRHRELISESAALVAASRSLVSTSDRLVRRIARLQRDIPSAVARRIRGGSAEDDSAGVRAKLAAGQLPLTDARKTWFGYGTHRPCAACDYAIGPRQVEVEADFENRETIRFHLACFDQWRRERLRAAVA